ncbi:MAG: hypothetical protein P8X57_08970, partial [Cyclobacteriaceae bacterium]
RADSALREDLLRHQQDFYSSPEVAGGYIVSSADPWLLHDFATLLSTHQIRYQVGDDETSVNDNSYAPGESLIIPLAQPQHRLITSIFERRTSFTDSLFYDISAWNMPMAFNLDYQELSSRAVSAISAKEDVLGKPVGGIEGGQASYAYVIPWNNYYSPAVLNRLQKSGLLVKMATAAFNGSNGKQYKRGTLMVPVNGQNMEPDEVSETIAGALKGMNRNPVDDEAGLHGALWQPVTWKVWC